MTLDIKGHICPRQVRIEVDVINIKMDEDGKQDVQIACVKKVRWKKKGCPSDPLTQETYASAALAA